MTPEEIQEALEWASNLPDGPVEVTGGQIQEIIANQQDVKTMLFFLFLVGCVTFGALVASIILRQLFRGL